MEQRVLEKNSYLAGLEELLKGYDIREVYTFDRFVGTKDDGVVLLVYGIDIGVANKLSEYIDNYMEDDTDIFPEQRSYFLPTKHRPPDGAVCIYKDGVFYSWKE